MELTELHQIRSKIAGLKNYVDSGTLPIDKKNNLNSIRSEIQILQTEIATLQSEIAFLQNDNLGKSTLERIDRPGWPKTLTAQNGWLWKYINFDHDKCHKDDIAIDMRTDSSGNNRFTIKKGETTHVVQFGWFLSEWFNDSDYSATCHNYTTKAEFYKQDISKNNDDINTKRTELATKQNLLALKQQLEKTTASDEMTGLKNELLQLEVKLRSSYEEFYQSVIEKSELFNRLHGMVPDISLVFKMLNDEKLSFFRYVIQDLKLDNFLELIQQIDAGN